METPQAAPCPRMVSDPKRILERTTSESSTHTVPGFYSTLPLRAPAFPPEFSTPLFLTVLLILLYAVQFQHKVL